jgi:glycosyltransferase involved in cell wall biosynthesis
MHVLQINKFLYSRGGAESVMFRTADLLREHGHEVSFFAMQDPQNLSCPEAPYFPRGRYYDSDRGLVERARNAGASIYSWDARRALRRLLRARRPDIAHLHNVYHQLTLSLLDELQAQGVPTVLTIHDCKPVCPNYKLYTRGEPCRRCITGSPAQAIVHRCVKDSRLASAVGAVETVVARARRFYHRVDALVVPSRHLANMMMLGGLPAERIATIPNFIADAQFGDPTRRRIAAAPEVLYVGRLEEDKGVRVLLAAAAQVADRIKTVVIGQGPLEEEVRSAQQAGAVEYLGRRAWNEVADAMDRAWAVVIPSLVEENCPMVALEAGARGCPIVASDRGGLPELVDEGLDGMLFSAGDPHALAGALRHLAADPSLPSKLGVARYERVGREHTAEKYLSALLAVYDAALAGAPSGCHAIV